MKLFSWNVLDQNLHIVEATEFILSGDYDIICLQEAPLQLIDRLTKFIGTPALTLDHNYKINKKEYPCYLAIYTKYQVVNRDRIVMGIKRKQFEAFSHVCDTALFNDVLVSNEMYRIFNCHFPVSTGPMERIDQLMTVISHFDQTKQNIICGDFNSYSNVLINILAGLPYRYKLNEYFINEKSKFKNIFLKNSLVNVFEGKVTFPLFHSQLDHILVQRDLIFNNAEVLKGVGSDHKALSLKITNY